MEQLTAAHRTMPFETWVRVVNLSNNKNVVVRITDRGPFIDGRIIDLSRAAAREIDLLRDGVTNVRLEVVKAPPEMARAHSAPRYTLQAGAFREEANARELAARLEDLLKGDALRNSMPAETRTGPSAKFDESRRLWKVSLGQFTSLPQAQEAALGLRRNLVDAFVVALDPKE